MSNKPRYDRHVDGYPSCYIHGSDVVCKTRESAESTDEAITSRSVRPCNMMTNRTFLTGVSRIDLNYRDTHDRGFVHDELFELIESPRMLSASLRPVNRYPLPDALEFFKGDYGSGVFGFRNNLFGDAMISIASKTRFLLTDLLKMPFGTFSTTFLKCCFDGVISLLSTVDGFSGEGNAVRINGKVDNTNIHAEHPHWFDHVCFKHINDHAKIEDTIPIDEIDLTSDSVELGSMVMSEDNRDYDPALEGKDRNPICALPREDTLVVDHSTVGSERRLDRFIPFVCFNHFGNGSDSHLRRKTISLSDTIVHNLLKLDLVNTTFFKRSGGNIVTRFIESAHGLKEKIMLIFGWVGLNDQCLKHHIDIEHQCLNSLWSPIPPTIKHRDFIGEGR